MKNWKIYIIFALVFAAGCASGKIIQKETASATSEKTETKQAAEVLKQGKAAPLLFTEAKDYPSFIDKDERKSLLKALKLNETYLKNTKKNTEYDFAGKKITAADLAETNAALKQIIEENEDTEKIAALIKEKFEVYQMSGTNSDGIVTFTSYYEPTTEASLSKEGEYKYPMYAKPDDLITVQLENFNPKFNGETINGRIEGRKLIPYYTRDEIDFQGKFKGRGLEIAWFKNLPDLMDLHIQGSGRLALPDGREIKALFAATNGLKFKGWLSAMIEQGLIPKEGISHEKGKEYLKKHPEKTRQVMAANPRYTFFKLYGISDPDEGPFGTYGYPLTGWRSVAADISLYPLGAACFLTAPMPDVDNDGNYKGMKDDARFVFVQDTGGAIKGSNRIDFFAGNGKKSRTFAFKVMNKGKLYMLLLKK